MACGASSTTRRVRDCAARGRLRRPRSADDADEEFLPELTDEARRQWIGDFFLNAQARAYSFADLPGHWMPLHHVDYVDDLGNKSKKGEWSLSGRIQLVGRTDVGSLFNDIFHAAYHRSPLHAGEDLHWKEAFCDAFRYTQEKELLPPPASSWVKKMDEYGATTMDQAQRRPAITTGSSSTSIPRRSSRRSGGRRQGLYAL